MYLPAAIICTSDSPNGSCADLLMTLGSKDDSVKWVDYFQNLFSGRSIDGVGVHSGGEEKQSIQFDIEKFLETAPVEEL